MGVDHDGPRPHMSVMTSIRYPARGTPILDTTTAPRPREEPPSRWSDALERGGDLAEIALMLGTTASELRRHIKEGEQRNAWRFEVSAWRTFQSGRKVIAAGRLIRTR